MNYMPTVQLIIIIVVNVRAHERDDVAKFMRKFKSKMKLRASTSQQKLNKVLI